MICRACTFARGYAELVADFQRSVGRVLRNAVKLPERRGKERLPVTYGEVKLRLRHDASCKQVRRRRRVQVDRVGDPVLAKGGKARVNRDTLRPAGSASSLVSSHARKGAARRRRPEGGAE